MLLEKINWKFYVKTGGEKVTDHKLFTIFNRWIPDSPEIFIDPSNYFHVSNGPKLILAGYYVNFYWDATDHELGFVYSRVRPMTEENNLKRLESSFRNAITRFLQLSLDKELEQTTFHSQKIALTINDRGIAPNEKATWEEIRHDVESFTHKTLGAVIIHRNKDPQRLFQLTILLSEQANWEKVLQKLD